MRTLIITGGRFEREFAASFLKKNKYDKIIAVDRGLDYLEELGVVPDLIVGDFDSCEAATLKKYQEKNVVIRRFLPEKDDTDTEIAVREAVSCNSDMDILCATGGRLDHFLSTLGNMKLALTSGIKARIIDSSNVIYLQDGAFSIDKEGKNYISFLPFEGEVKNLKLKGFKYNLDGYDLKPGTSRCISNEIVDDKAFVSFDYGCLIVIEASDIKSE